MTTRETKAALLDLRGINQALAPLAELVRWADGAGLERKVTGAGGGGHGTFDVGSLLCSCPTPLEQERRKALGLPPAGDCAACIARKVHRQALADVAAARASLNRARRSLERTLRAVGGSGTTVGSDEEHPRIANQADLREARAAQARRRARGEGQAVA